MNVFPHVVVSRFCESLLFYCVYLFAILKSAQLVAEFQRELDNATKILSLQKINSLDQLYFERVLVLPLQGKSSDYSEVPDHFVFTLEANVFTGMKC